jgi:hypothetical protein
MKKFQRTIKKTVLVVCEGSSEVNYIRALNRFLSANSPPCMAAITTFSADGGSAAAIIERAWIQAVRRKRNGESFNAIYAMLDTEPASASREKLNAATKKADAAGVKFIWQEGSHEAFLLSHFPSTDRSRDILDVWPGYRKAQDAIFYEKKLTLELYDRARKANVGFDEFLSYCGLPPHAAGA